MARTVTGESAGAFGSYTTIGIPQAGVGITPAAPAVPLTTVSAVNPVPVAATVIITAGTSVISNVTIAGTTAGTAAGTYTVPAGASISVAYTVAAPTWAWTWPAMPASTVGLVSGVDRTVTVVITGGTMTNVSVNGATVGTGAGTYTVPAFGTITMTYSVAPTWTWSIPAIFTTALNANGTPVAVTGVS